MSSSTLFYLYFLLLLVEFGSSKYLLVQLDDDEAVQQKPAARNRGGERTLHVDPKFLEAKTKEGGLNYAATLEKYGVDFRPDGKVKDMLGMKVGSPEFKVCYKCMVSSAPDVFFGTDESSHDVEAEKLITHLQKCKPVCGKVKMPENKEEVMEVIALLTHPMAAHVLKENLGADFDKLIKIEAKGGNKKFYF